MKNASEMNETERAAKLAVELQAVARKHRMVDLDGLKLIDTGRITLQEDGSIKGADSAIAELKERWPSLFAKHFRDMSEVERSEWWQEYRKKFPDGRPRPKPMDVSKKASEMSKAEQENFLRECARRE